MKVTAKFIGERDFFLTKNRVYELEVTYVVSVTSNDIWEKVYIPYGATGSIEAFLKDWTDIKIINE